MLSLFIALLLLLGLNAIFTASTKTIQAGTALNDATRNARAVGPIFFNDLRNCATDSPAFVISSCYVPQFLSKSDATASGAQAGQLPTVTVTALSGGASQSTVYPVTGCLLGDHLHRCDSLSFFARGLFKRKTADGPNFLASTTTSDEAFIHYGHIRILANDGQTYIGPDDYAGLAAPYASSWVLGRNAILLSDSSVLNASAKDLGGLPEWYFGSGTALSAFGSYPSNIPSNIPPLGYSALSGGNRASPSVRLQSSRYDLAGATIDEFRSIITNAAYNQGQETLPVTSTATSAYYTWWLPLVYQCYYSGVDINNTSGGTAYYTGPASFPYYTPEISGLPYNAAPLASSGIALPTPYNTSTLSVSTSLGRPAVPPSAGNYAFNIPNPNGGTANPNQWLPRFRFQGSNTLSQSPETSNDQAGLSPYLLEHVSQFIVEYAGDFVTQDNSTGPNSGNVTDTVPDGQIDWVYATKGDWNAATTYSLGDYVLVPQPAGGVFYYCATNTGYVSPYLNVKQLPATSAGYWTQVNLAGGTPPPPPRQIRWYGMPRDVTGSGQVFSSSRVYTGVTTVPTANELNNVVPLADVWMTSANNPGRPLPYEVEQPGPTSNLASLNIAVPNPVLAQPVKTAIPDYAATAYTATTAPVPTNSYLNPQYARYTAVWRNDVPAMVRILMKVDDPNGAMQDGPWFEYVFKLK